VQADAKPEAPGLSLLKWLKDNGAEQEKVELRTLEVPAAGAPTQFSAAVPTVQACHYYIL
jgi:hypothetical protein